MKKVCPCCGVTFECNNDDIFNCHCITIGLSNKKLYYLSLLYNSCLCHACLQHISEMSESDLAAKVSKVSHSTEKTVS